MARLRHILLALMLLAPLPVAAQETPAVPGGAIANDSSAARDAEIATRIEGSSPPSATTKRSG